MKKTLVFLPLFVLCVVLFGFRASADGAESVYLISEESGEYTLSEYDTGEPLALMRGTAAEIFRYIGERAEPATVILDGINLTSPLELPKGSYTLTGELALTQYGRLIISEGTSISMSELTLTATGTAGTAVRVKGGEVRIDSSSISSVGSGVFLLDYSESSRLTLASGTLSSSSDSPTLEIKSGRAVLLSGRIDNSHAAAVGNDAGLFLSGDVVISGTGCDVSTEKPITLSYGGISYLGVSPLCVKFLSDFAPGSITEIFYSSSESATQKIILLNKDGREYPITYFSECEYAAEKSFSAVYLPFTATLYDGDGRVYTEYYLKNEKITERPQTKREGYEPCGWYTDPEGKKKYSFDKALEGDISLFGVYRLLPPEFSVSSVSTVYDGCTHALSFDRLTHPLLDCGGFFTYEWIKDGECISREAALSYFSASDSGEYTCRITFHYNSDSSVAVAEGIMLTVDKKALAVPTTAPKIYSGMPETPDLDPSTLYTAELPTGTEAGKYTVIFTLNDFENYRWDSTDSSVAESVFEILCAENRFTESIFISDVYCGNTPRPSAKALFGEVSYLYSLTEGGEYSERIPTAAGGYYVRAIVVGTASYTSLTSEPHFFSILPEEVSSLSVLNMPNKTSYRAFESFSPVGLELTVRYNSGRSEVISADEVSFSYQSGSSFLYGDGGVVLSYGGVSIPLPLEVTRADYDLSSLDLSPIVTTYDGSYHSYERDLPKIVGLDGEILSINITGGGTDAGDYTLTLSFSTVSKNYNIPKNMTVKLVVNRYKTEVLWEECNFVYNTKEQSPVAYYLDVYGARRTLSVAGGRTFAGEDYLATVGEIQGNYEFYNTSCTFSIKRADYDLTGVRWSDSSFVYDNTERTVYLYGLPDGISVVGYTDAAATAAGQYTATASVVYDSENYNPPPVFSVSWQILPAEYDMSGVSISSGSFVYDGNVHFPTVNGSMPKGLDGTSPTYSFSGGAREVSEGRVSVRVEFSTESKNYNPPAPIEVYISITPKPISVNWLSDSFVYDGKEHLPAAISGECAVRVSGGATDAGEYVAVATPESENYSIINKEYSFVILRAPNYWITQPSISDVYEGDALNFSAEAYTGTPKIRFYSDRACQTEIDRPTESGRYYALVLVEESKNYLELRSEILEFTIIKVVPVSFTVEIFAERLVAFYTLTPEDMLVTVSYNNGRTLPLSDLSELSVIYENGDSLRRKDECVSFSYADITLEIPVRVARADYSPQDFVWESGEFVYNGTSQHPTLKEMPKGVSVLEYVGVGVGAGKYTVVANISYDTENYNPPPAISAQYTIAKAQLTPEKLPELIYNGRAQIPSSNSTLYKLECSGECINAGEYTVTYTLYDKDNYVFSGSDSHVLTRTLLISPIALRAELSDLEIYLFGDKGELDYTLDVSSVVLGDTVNVGYYISGERVYLSSDNPNYTLVFTPAKIQKQNTLSAAARIRLFYILLCLLLLTLIAITLVTQRDRIKGLYSLALCRYRNRNVNQNCHYMAKIEVKEEKQEKTAEEFVNKNVLAAPKNEPDPKETAEETDAAFDLKDELASHTENKSVFEENEDALPGAETKKSLALAEISEENSETDGRARVEDITASDLSLSVDREHADELITDSLAKDLVKKNREIVYTTGRGKGIINVDTLSDNFISGDRVDVNVLKAHKLVSQDTAYLKVLARGSIDKPLSVYANDFSLSAVKMICLTGGEAVKVATVREKQKNEKTIEK